MNILIIQGGPGSRLVTGEEVVVNNDILFLQQKNYVHFLNIKLRNRGFRSFFDKVGGMFWSFSSYKKVINSIKKYKPDIIHFHTTIPYLSFSVIFAAYWSGVPVVQSLHNGRWLCLEGAYFRNNSFCNDCVGSMGGIGVIRGCGHGKIISSILFINNFILRKTGLLYKYVSRFIAVSEFVREQHILSGFPHEKVITRYNGFNFELFNINSLNVSWELRRGIVFAGRVSIAKGALVLEYLISKLDCPIHIIGNGPELSKLIHYCKENHFSHVSFYGKIANIDAVKIMGKSIATVVPSQCGDSFPTAALESLSVGTPVIASSLGGLTELIKNSKGGLIVRHDNKKHFCELINAFLSDKLAAKEMGDAGRIYAEKNLSNKKQGLTLIEIYKEVLSEHREKSK